MFSYFRIFGVSLLKMEYLTEIEKKLGKSGIISCIVEKLKPSSFVTEYLSENLQICDSVILILASEYGHLEVVKLLLHESRINPSADNNRAIQSASKNGHLEMVKYV